MIAAQQLVSEFTYTNIVGTTELYDSTATYGLGDLARVGNYVYKSTLAGNIGNSPLSTLGIYWIEWAPSNAYAMLDLFSDTKTEWAENGIVEFDNTNIDTIGIGNFKANTITIEYLASLSGVVSGLTISTSVDLSSTITAGLVYVDLVRFDIEDTLKTFTALKDTYVDIDSTGTIIYTEVANGDPAPAITSPNQRIAMVETDIDNIIAVTDLRTIIDPVISTDTYTFTSNSGVYDLWTYIYSGFPDYTASIVYKNLQQIGIAIRVTFSASGSNTYCGFLVAGKGYDFGKTLDGVTFPDKLIGSSTVTVATFKTAVPNFELIRKLNYAKTIRDIAMLFVIDESPNTVHNNMAILGKITKVDGIGENQEDNFMSWQIEQNIIQ